MSTKKPVPVFRREGFELRMAPWIAKHLVDYHLKGNGRILDVGCGDGILTDLIERGVQWPDNIHKMFGLDINFYNADHRFARLDPTDFLNIAKPKAKFSHILMTEYLEHVADPQAHLRKARSLLEPDGRLVVQCPNATSANRRLGQLMGIISHSFDLTEADRNAGHRRFYDIGRLIVEVRKAGFIVTSCHSYFYKPFPNRAMEHITRKYADGGLAKFMAALYAKTCDDDGALVCVEGTPDPEVCLRRRR